MVRTAIKKKEKEEIAVVEKLGKFAVFSEDWNGGEP